MAIARVSGSAATANSGAATVTSQNIVMGNTPTAGNVIVLAISSSAPVTLAPGNIEWMVIQAIQSSTARCGYIAVGRVLTGASATITVTTQTSAAIAIAGDEFSGCVPKFDRSQWAGGSSTAVASGTSGTTSTANQLWVGSLGTAASGGTTFSSPSNGFSISGQTNTTIGSTTDKSVALTFKIVSATGTVNSGATAAATGVWTAIVVTLEETPAGGGGETSHTFIQ